MLRYVDWLVLQQENFVEKWKNLELDWELGEWAEFLWLAVQHGLECFVCFYSEWVKRKQGVGILA